MEAEMETPKKPREGGAKNDDNAAVVTPSGPLSDKKSATQIKEPHANDVLCGRGGSINSHSGNERFRLLVEKRKRVYLTARFKREKRLIANSIVSEIRSLTPPGRFLARDSKTGMWYDIGDEKARDKTSQALRENAPSIRAEIEVEINQQRAEMQRAEEQHAAQVSASHHGPPHPYYQQPWGYYTPYHGYGHYPSHPPGYEPEGYDIHQWHTGPATPPRSSPSSVTSRRGGSQGHYSYRYDSAGHSAAESGNDASFDMPKLVTSVPSSLAAWTRSSFSFGGHSSASEPHERSDRTSEPLPTTRPLSYVHSAGDTIDRERSRVVHFKDEHPSPKRRPHHSSNRRYQHFDEESRHPGYSPPVGGIYSHARNPTAVTPDRDRKLPATVLGESQEIEPHDASSPFNDAAKDPSLLTQVANHILGSWDTGIACTQDSTSDTAALSRWGSAPEHREQYGTTSLVDTTMGEEEGQEVELVEMDTTTDDFVREDMMETTDDEPRMPPPPIRRNTSSSPKRNRRIEIDWPSKMVGCQTTWLPDTFNPPSFFSGRSNPLSPSASLEMDASAVGTEAGSIGGASLCQVFSQDQITADDAIVAPGETVSHHVLSQMPSWERSFRSKSPSTVCSDPSIISKASDRADGRISPLTTPSSPRLQDSVE